MKSVFSPEQDKAVAKFYVSGLTAQQIAYHYGVYKQSVLTSLKRSGIERRKDWKRASGEDNGNWGGGTRTICGYLYVHLPEHRLARKDGWVAIHRLKMDEKLTDKKQVVHHIDGNKLNNEKSNLEVYENNGVHRQLHSKDQGRDEEGRFI